MLSDLYGAIAGFVTAKKQKDLAEQQAQQAERTHPGYADPLRLMTYNKVNRMQNAISTGSYASSISDSLLQTGAATADAATTLASGSGADVTGLLRVNRNMGSAFGQAAGELAKQNMQMMGLEEKLMSDIVATERQQKTLENTEAKLREQQLTEASWANKQAAAAGIGAYQDAGIDLVLSLMGKPSNVSGKKK